MSGLARSHEDTKKGTKPAEAWELVCKARLPETYRGAEGLRGEPLRKVMQQITHVASESYCPGRTLRDWLRLIDDGLYAHQYSRAWRLLLMPLAVQVMLVLQTAWEPPPDAQLTARLHAMREDREIDHENTKTRKQRNPNRG